MRFGHPHFFWLLWLIPGIVVFYVWAFKHKRRLIEQFVSPELKERLLMGVSVTRQRWKAICLVFCCVFVVLALVRPKFGFHWEEVQRKGVDIMVALDVSQSMMAADVKPNRLERAKREIVDLLRIIEGDRVGLIAFAGTSFVQCPLTLDHGAVQLFLDSLSSDLIPVPGTAIGEAITKSIESFQSSGKKSRALILITDGEDHLGQPIEAAKKANEAGIRIYSVGIGKEGGAPIPNREGGGFKKDRDGNVILTKLDEAALQKIALETGGSYVRSVTGDLDLERIYEDVRKSLDQADLQSGMRKRFEERYQWPLLLALFFLCGEALLSERRRVRRKALSLGFSKKATIALALIWLMGSSALLEGSSATRGARQYQAEEYDEALTSMLDAQVENPQDPDIKYNLANTYYQLGRYEEAEKLFASTAVQAEAPLDQKAHYNWGNTLFRQGKLMEALKQYERALELNPEDEDAKHNLEHTRKEIKRRLEEQKKQPQQSQNQKQNQNPDQKQNQKQDQKQQQNQDQQKQAQNQPKPQKGDEKKEEQKQASAQSGKAKPLSKEEAERLLKTLKDDRSKFQRARMQGEGRYQVEKDW